ncbi:MAG: hypothetical protein NTX71_10420 [Candidatus Aureabacteria bacterium]|nr:hypothetical protein [Candidatus Auribacterota bacterium]
MTVRGLMSLRRLRVVGVLVYPVAFFAVMAYMLLLATDYNATWAHPELPLGYVPNALRYGTAFSIRDFIRGFDYMQFDGAPRPRFVSYSFQIINEKFRIWLFHYVIPHPSLSLTWIFTLILSPVLLFAFLSRLVRTPLAGWIGVTLYFASPGCLSGIALLFQPAKPLATFFSILCLYCALRVSAAIEARGSLSMRAYSVYLFLLCMMFLSFCIDETAWFLYIIIPVLFPGIFTRGDGRPARVMWYISTGAAYSIFVLYLMPRITTALGYGGFEFLKFTTGRKDSFHAENLIYNAWKLTSCQIIFSMNLFGHDIPTAQSAPAGAYQVASWVYAVIFAGCLAWLALRLPRCQRKVCGRYFLAWFLFVVFETMLLTKQGHKTVINSSYYYGALASVFLTIPLAIVLSSSTEGASGMLSKVLFSLIVAASLYNFVFINESWIQEHSRVVFYQEFMQPGELETWGPLDAKVSYDMVRKAWRNRHDKDMLNKMKSSFPLRACWLFRELEYIR